MGNVISFKKPSPKEKSKGKTLCSRGFHKWVAEKATPFDVDSGRLISRFRCSRCGKIRTEAR